MARVPTNRLGRAGSAGRRAWPLLLMAWERWQALPEADKERYRRQVAGSRTGASARWTISAAAGAAAARASSPRFVAKP